MYTKNIDDLLKHSVGLAMSEEMSIVTSPIKMKKELNRMHKKREQHYEEAFGNGYEL